MKNNIVLKDPTTEDLKKFNESLKRLHTVLTEEVDNYQRLLENYLKIGSEIFNLETGIVSHIEEDEYTVMATNAEPGTIEKGQVFPLVGTYCVEVYKSKKSVALTAIGQNEKMCKHPVYEAMKLESYISSPIFVNGKLYGTINFTSLGIRQEGFHSHELEMLELMSLNIGRMLELQEARTRLDEEQKENKRQKEFYDDVLNGMIDGYVVQDKGGAIIKFNKRSYEILGLTEDQLLGKTSMDPGWKAIKETGDIFPGNEHPAMISLVEGKSSEGVIMGIQTPAREEKWISINSTPLYFGEDGLPTHAVTTFTEVTKQIEFQKLLSKSRQKAEQASKSKTDFLANMSHEIRTPLNGVVGMVSLLEDTQLNPEQSEILHTIHRSSDILLAVINDVLDISKIEAGKTELNEIPFDLYNCIQKSINLYKEQAHKKNVELEFYFDEKLPRLYVGDEIKCLQIINNLVSNAIKFTSDGKVVVDCSGVKQNNSKIKMEISIADSGIGILPEKRKNLFQAFSQIDYSITREYGGTGLGLVICRKLAMLMGGDISLDETVNTGSRFVFSNTFEVAKNINKIDDQNLSEIRPELKVLLAEDNEVNSLIVEKMLKKINVSIDIATNGLLAYEMAKGAEYDLILMDIQMPVMDGITSTHKILNSKETGKPKIIAMTANAFEEDKKTCFEIGMVDFLSKPIKKERLYEMLRKHQGE